MKKIFNNKFVCEVCKKKAEWKQYSPDYGFYYFCSVKHCNEYQAKMVYRALPLESITNLLTF